MTERVLGRRGRADRRWCAGPSVLAAALIVLCLGLPGAAGAASLRARADTTAHAPLAIVVTGDQIDAPASMATYSGNAYWLTKAEVAALKSSRGVLDPNGGLWISDWFSWCEDHGAPVHGWTRVAGIGLKELLADAGLGTAQIAALGPVTFTSSAEADSYSFVVDMSVVRRRFTAADALSGEPIDPMLALYFDDTDTYAALPAEATTAVEGVFTTLVFGQVTTAESNRCGFVADASLVSLPEASPAFLVDAPDAYAAGERQKTKYSLAALVGGGNVRRTYTVAGAPVTCDGVDLKALLDGARGAIHPQDRLVLVTSAGTVDMGLCVSDVGAGDRLLAYFSQTQGGAPVANATQVMVYGDGAAFADVLSLRVDHVDPTAGLVLTSPTVSQSAASVAAGGRLALRAVAVPAAGAAAADPVTWTSSAPGVATVGATGTVAARRAGRAIVTAASGSFSRSFTVSVVARARSATSIRLPKDKATTAGSTLRLAVRVLPSTATSTITWKSSSPGVAKVDRGGTLTAVKRGKTTISVRTSNGKTASCVLTVR